MIQQLRVYEINTELKAEFGERFEKHALRIMKSYGFKVQAMWYSVVTEKTEFIYILQWTDETAMDQAWKAFMADEEWEEIKKQSRDQYGEMVFAKVRDQVLEPTSWFSNDI